MPSHLIACHHGFMGYSGHLSSIMQELSALQKNHDVKLILLNSEVNNWHLTMDGIDLCGQRFAEDIKAALEKIRSEEKEKERENLTEEEPLLTAAGDQEISLSVIGYSLGGLISRYALGLLEEAGELEGIRLRNFVTVATPHLGSRKLPSGYGNLFNFVTPRICSRTGEQLLLEDHDHNHGCPLLLLMTLRDTPFYRALARFEERKLYANALFDRTVAYRSASISKSNPYRSASFKPINDKCPHIVEPHDATVQPPSRWKTVLGVAAGIALVPFLPLAAVIGLIVLLLIVLSGQHSRFRLWRGSQRQRSKVEELRVKHHLGSTDLQELRKESFQQKIREEIISNLNELSWKRYDVMIPSLNSHGRVIARSKNFLADLTENGGDVILHLAENLIL